MAILGSAPALDSWAGGSRCSAIASPQSIAALTGRGDTKGCRPATIPREAQDDIGAVGRADRVGLAFRGSGPRTLTARFGVGGRLLIAGWRDTGLLSGWIANPSRQAPHPCSATRRLELRPSLSKDTCSFSYGQNAGIDYFWGYPTHHAYSSPRRKPGSIDVVAILASTFV